MGSAFDPEISLRAAEAEADAELRRQRMIRRIDAALARIEEGEYGYCLVCGAEIAATRLDREPTTDLCGECAARSRQA